jgi:hypothetical protein
MNEALEYIGVPTNGELAYGEKTTEKKRVARAN